jgi:protease II
VRHWQVQERGWIYSLQHVRGGLELACAEYSFGRLRLQLGLVGT